MKILLRASYLLMGIYSILYFIYFFPQLISEDSRFNFEFALANVPVYTTLLGLIMGIIFLLFGLSVIKVNKYINLALLFCYISLISSITTSSLGIFTNIIDGIGMDNILTLYKFFSILWYISVILLTIGLIVAFKKRFSNKQT